jgi:hypothetical protein
MLVKIMWYDDIGRNRVLTRPLGAISQILMALTFLKVYGVSISLWLMIAIVAAYFIVESGLGWVYVRMGLMKIETDLYNEQNEIFQKINKKEL